MAQNYFGKVDLVSHIEITNAIATALGVSPGNLIGREFFFNASTLQVSLEEGGRYTVVTTLDTLPGGESVTPGKPFRGSWSTDEDYLGGQIVLHNGIDWIGAYPSTGEEPGESLAWRRLVSLGVPEAWEPGAYSAATIVAYEGQFFVARVDTESGPPDASPDWVETLSAGPAGPPGPSGFDGWAPILAGEVDGLRRVIKVTGWTGGEGTAPTLLGYLGATGLVPDIADAIDFRGPAGPQGEPGAGSGGGGGDPGYNGWSPQLSIENDGVRRVFRVVDWSGGTGSKPAIGSYVGATGLVSDIAAAVDIRGSAGLKGWSPQLALYADGERRVLRVVDWTGGDGAKPTALGYIGAGGLVDAIADGLDVRGSQGPQGPAGSGSPGTAGTAGWSPVIAGVQDGNRRLFQVADWVGGQGAKPAVGQYLGALGYVTDITLATDYRGGAGPSGPQGAKGWSPIFGAAADGERRVLRVADWVGGDGAKPTGGQYVGEQGLVQDIALAIDMRGAVGAKGDTGQGDRGWSPVLAAEADGVRCVLKVVGWAGGLGTPPSTSGYLGPTSIVDSAADALDVRGLPGMAGEPGPPGPPDTQTVQYRNEAQQARDEAVTARNQSINIAGSLGSTAAELFVARDEAVEAAASIKLPGAISRGRDTAFPVPGSGDWVTIPLDVGVYFDPDYFDYEPSTNSLVPKFGYQERLELFAAVRFAKNSGGTYRAMRIVAVNPANAADVLVPLEKEVSPSGFVDSVIDIANVSFPPSGWKLQLQARHDFSVLGFPQDINITGCYLTALSSRGRAGRDGILTLAGLDREHVAPAATGGNLLSLTQLSVDVGDFIYLFKNGIHVSYLSYAIIAHNLIQLGTPIRELDEFEVLRPVGQKGENGNSGDNGWAPILAAIADGERRILQVADWTGGGGSKPASGQYVGITGLVADIASAVDVRGSTGTAGGAGADGTNGWSPILAVIADGVRSVLQVIDWAGGSGSKPSTGQYVGTTGLVADIASAVDVRGATGAGGAPGTNGTDGTNGTNGWSPILAVIADGSRSVLQVIDWTGGSGSKPAAGQYVGTTGLVANIASAVDVRGVSGAASTSEFHATNGSPPTAVLNRKRVTLAGSTDSSGEVVFVLTTTGGTGASDPAIFTAIHSIQVTAVRGSTSAIDAPSASVRSIASGLKTVTAKVICGNAVVLGGSPQQAAPSGIGVYLVAEGV